MSPLRALDLSKAFAWRRLNAPAAEQGHADAIEWFRKSAHAEAQHMLGFMYDYGQGVPQDVAEGMKWHRKAADQGFAKAQADIGFMYKMGWFGVTKDHAEATKWYRMAAE